MGFASGFNPLRAKLWGKSIAIKVGVNLGYHGGMGVGQRLRIELGAANDPTGQPMVTRLKCAMSSGKCQGRALFLPMTPLRALANMRCSCMQKINQVGVGLLRRLGIRTAAMAAITQTMAT